MDELLQGRTLGEQLRQPRLQHHVGQDGQQVVCAAVTTGAISRAGHKDWRPNTALASGPTPAPHSPCSLHSHGGRGEAPAVPGAAVLLGTLADAAQGSHCGTGRESGPQPPWAPAPRPQRRSPMHSSFLRGQLSSGISRRSCTAEAYAGRPGPGGKRREASPMSAGPACRCRSMLRARAASRGCCTVLRARR